MKIIPRLLTVLICLLGTAALAQAPLRVLVLPFDTAAAAENYSLGLAAGIQRGLNSLDGVYVPPVGDGALVVGRAARLDVDLTSTVTELFQADVIISGALSQSDSQLQVTLAFSGPLFPEGEQTSYTVAAVSSSLMRTAVEAILERLDVTIDATVQARLDAIAAQAPSVFGLGPVGTAAARLGGSTSDLASALESDGNSAWVHSEYARVLMLSGNPEAALSASTRALELNRNDVESLVNHGIILSQLGRRDEAVAVFDEALALNSWHAIGLAGQAVLLPGAGEATRQLERATDSYPRLLDAWLDLAELSPDTGRALQQLRRAAAYLPESVQLHRAFVVRTVASGDAAGALAYLQQLAADPLAASPNLYSLATLLPDSLASEATALVRQGSSAFPESTIPGLTEAQLLRRAGRVSEAETLLRTLNTAHPDDVEVVNQLAITVAVAGRVDEARQLFESIAGSSAVVQLNLADVLLQEGQAQAALQVLQPLAEQPGADADTITLYAEALARTGNTAAAETAFRQALTLDPEWQRARSGLSQLTEQQQVTGGQQIEMPAQAASAFERGLNALRSGNFPNAVLEFSSATASQGGALAQFYLGYALQMDGQIREAITAYEAAREGLPESDVVLNNLGYAQLVVGRYDLALPLLREAVTLNSGNAQAHMNLGLTYFGLSRYADAVAAWEQALGLQPALAASLDDLIQEARSRSGQ